MPMLVLWSAVAFADGFDPALADQAASAAGGDDGPGDPGDGRRERERRRGDGVPRGAGDLGQDVERDSAAGDDPARRRPETR